MTPTRYWLTWLFVGGSALLPIYWLLWKILDAVSRR